MMRQGVADHFNRCHKEVVTYGKIGRRISRLEQINKEREELITEGEFNQIKEELFRSFILKLGELGDTKHNKQYWCDKLGK